jgi:hypothetical protein
MSRTNLRRRRKPFWNLDLQAKWDILCVSEKNYLKAPQSSRQR